MSQKFDSKRFGFIPQKISLREASLIFPQKLFLTETTIKNLEKIAHPLREGRNLLLVGNVGVGKNALIYYINQIRNLPTIRFSFNQDTMTEDLIGSFQVLPDGFHWQDGPLSNAMKKGYTFVADEMNLASPEILKRFLSVLKNRYLHLLEKDTSCLNAHERFHFVATQNPSRGFEGRKPIPPQVQKLFTIVYIDPYPINEQVEIVQSVFSDAPLHLIEQVIQLQNQLEEKIWSSEIAKNSLEHYHFNIRSVQRFWSRLFSNPQNEKIQLNAKDDTFLFNLFRFYVDCFPEQKSREISLSLIQSIFNLSQKNLYDAYHSFIHQKTPEKFYTFIKNYKGKNKQEYLKRYELDPFPITDERFRLLKEIQQSIENSENLLLEGDESSRIEELIGTLSLSYGQKVTHIHLSKGMHISDIIGSLKPIQKQIDGKQNYEQIQWVDGPLTRSIKNQEWVILENIEAAGSEIIEKLNMLLDDASQLLLPPEAEPEILIKKTGATRIIAVKYFRKSRSQSTISRAFRNRFFNIIIPRISDGELFQSGFLLFNSLFQIKNRQRTDSQKTFIHLLEKMVEFHKRLNIALISKKIEQNMVGNDFYQEENLLRWIRHLYHTFVSSDQKPTEEAIFHKSVMQGAEVHYLSALPREKDREWGRSLLRSILQELPLDKIEQEFSTLKKKIISSPEARKMTWDPKKYFREAVTGKARPRFSGSPLKKGIRINTPETGGSIKEGEDAWYGRDTLGNKGVGVPQGGGAWGYRTQEVFDEFLKKYSPKWSYELGFQLKDYYDYFGSMLRQIDLNLDNALQIHTNIERKFSSRGHQVDIKKYLSYLTHQGSERIFSRSSNLHKENQWEGLEFIFLINKGRRLFNFKYSTAAIVALQSAIEMLNDHHIACKLFGYSDLENMKTGINLVEYTDSTNLHSTGHLSEIEKNDIFEKMMCDWNGDTVEEYLILQKASSLFSPYTLAKFVIMVSDFRGHRARQALEEDAFKRENQILKKTIQNYSNQGYTFLGVQIGTRNIAEHLFDKYIWINSENFHQAPLIFAEVLQDLIVSC